MESDLISYLPGRPFNGKIKRVGGLKVLRIHAYLIYMKSLILKIVKCNYYWHGKFIKFTLCSLSFSLSFTHPSVPCHPIVHASSSLVLSFCHIHAHTRICKCSFAGLHTLYPWSRMLQYLHSRFQSLKSAEIEVYLHK